MMVDNILKDSGEVHGSDDEDLSGDEIKSPIFVITKVAADNAANRNNVDSESMNLNEDMDDGQEELMEKEDESFVQEEVSLKMSLIFYSICSSTT